MQGTRSGRPRPGSRAKFDRISGSRPRRPSRRGAQECSPRRKPWVRLQKTGSPGGAETLRARLQ